MRATIKVVGLGNRKAGVSKKGRAFDFVPVAFVMHDQQFQGFSAHTCNVAGSDIESVGGLKVNDEIDAFYHFENFAVVIDGLVR